MEVWRMQRGTPVVDSASSLLVWHKVGVIVPDWHKVGDIVPDLQAQLYNNHPALHELRIC